MRSAEGIPLVGRPSAATTHAIGQELRTLETPPSSLADHYPEGVGLATQTTCLDQSGLPAQPTCSLECLLTARCYLAIVNHLSVPWPLRDPRANHRPCKTRDFWNLSMRSPSQLGLPQPGTQRRDGGVQLAAVMTPWLSKGQLQMCSW